MGSGGRKMKKAGGESDSGPESVLKQMFNLYPTVSFAYGLSSSYLLKKQHFTVLTDTSAVISVSRPKSVSFSGNKRHQVRKAGLVC
jgi:hypothetical protein